MEERFRQREVKATALGGKAVERQNAVAATYAKAIDDYLALIDALPPDNTITHSSLDAFKSLLDRIITSKKRPLLGTLLTNTLPILLANLQLPPLFFPPTRGEPRRNRADTAASAEAPVSKEIADLAQSLQWNPVLIYEWVKNNVETEWYWGVMKGAEETCIRRAATTPTRRPCLWPFLRPPVIPPGL